MKIAFYPKHRNRELVVMKHLIGIAGCTLLLAVGCGKEPEPATKIPAVPAPESAPAAETPGAAPAPAPAARRQPTGGVASETINADHFGQLSQALLTFRRDKNRAPKDWQELIATGYLKQLPKPPAGRRYTFDPISLDVRLAVSQSELLN